MNEEVIYEDRRIKISQAESSDEHDLQIDGKDGVYCSLPRGVLKDLARRTKIESVRQSLDAMNPRFLYSLGQIKMPLETVAWAISKARMKELEQEVAYFMDEARRAKDRARTQ